MGEEMEGAMQQAPQPIRHAMGVTKIGLDLARGMRIGLILAAFPLNLRVSLSPRAGDLSNGANGARFGCLSSCRAVTLTT
jgi:hypothetical protein